MALFCCLFVEFQFSFEKFVDSYVFSCYAFLNVSFGSEVAVFDFLVFCRSGNLGF